MIIFLPKQNFSAVRCIFFTTTCAVVERILGQQVPQNLVSANQWLVEVIWYSPLEYWSRLCAVVLRLVGIRQQLQLESGICRAEVIWYPSLHSL